MKKFLGGILIAVGTILALFVRAKRPGWLSSQREARSA
jgi:hypothetical protein